MDEIDLAAQVQVLEHHLAWMEARDIARGRDVEAAKSELRSRMAMSEAMLKAIAGDSETISHFEHLFWMEVTKRLRAVPEQPR